jgi:signal transduction histidine kinase
MTTAVAPLTDSTLVAVCTADEMTYRWLCSLLESSPRGRYRAIWMPNGTALRAETTEGPPGVWLVDERVPAHGAQDWGGAEPVPMVRLVADGDALGDEPQEDLPAAQLTAVELDRALRRARRDAALRAELAQLRAERLERQQAQEQVQRERDNQDRLLQSIMQSLPILLGRLDRQGRVVETHGAGLNACGIDPTTLLHQRLAEVMPGAAPSVRQALHGEETTFSLRGRRHGQEWHADFVLLPESGDEGGAIFLGQDVSERRWLEQQLLSATDAEQQRIGADLHDGLGQQLTGLACLVAALRDRLRANQQEELAAQADFIMQVANDATRQSRALARGLCPVQLEGASLGSALRDLVFQAQQLHGISCRFRSRGYLRPLDHFTAIHLYHITQEALHNAVRHGSARNVRVTLVSCGSRHRLTIGDDGCGFDLHRQIPTASRGLRLMNYRAGMIGGILSLTSCSGRGTRVRCQFNHATSPHEDST